MERPKRQKLDSSGKSRAFEKLKCVRSGGAKNKVEITPVENVYEEVTEEEYTKTVLQRQQDDWIVGDSGADGYVEDGRELFDDDLDEESIERDKKSKKRYRNGAPKDLNSRNGALKNPKDSFQKMFANMRPKAKSITDNKQDELVDELLAELDQSSAKIESPVSVKTYGSRSLATLSRSAPNQSSNSKVAERTIIDDSSRIPSKDILEDRESANDAHAITPKNTNHSSNAVASSNVNLSDTLTNNTAFDDEIDPLMDVDYSTLASIEKDVKTALSNQAKSCEIVSNASSVATNGFDLADEIDYSKILDIEKDLKTRSVSNTDVKIDALPAWTGPANENVPVTNIDCSKLPLIDKEDGTKVLRFFYWDAYEDIFNKPGTIYLFGKVSVKGSEYVSCCISVRNIDRRVYLLPREKRFDLVKKQETDQPVSMLDMYHEVNDKISTQYRITKFKTRQVNKNYAFNLADVPDSSDYLEVRYGAEFAPLKSNLVGETFSHVFGTNTSFLELFLIERKIKGPCWLEIANVTPSNPSVSWCKFDVTCDDMVNVSVIPNADAPPPLVVLALNMRITPIPPKYHDNQITMISCLVHSNYYADKEAPVNYCEQHFCAFTKPVNTGWPYDHKEVLDKYKATKLHKCNSERELLNFFLPRFQKIDPDLIVGHDICGFDIGTLVHRLVANKIMHWSRLGRLRRSNVPNYAKSRNFAEKNILCGRLLCDVAISAKELIKARSYDLNSLCHQVLIPKEEIKKIKKGEEAIKAQQIINAIKARKDLSTDEIRKMFQESTSLLKLIGCTMSDAEYILRIMYELNVIPLSLQITNIAGNIFSRTLMGGRAERNEFLLLHAFNDKNYIVPDKTYGKKSGAKQDDGAEPVDEAAPTGGKGKRKPQYEGGLVLEPKKGFYDNFILLMDFNSLYPSIIQEFNICFTTVSVRGMDIDEGDIEMLLNHLPSSSSQPGILPAQIRILVERRRHVKSLMANPAISPDLKHEYNIRQLALKLTANSMYGCLGFPNSRFYAKPLAAMVTAKGRDILINTRDLVQRLNYDVIYGDTDSLMINTNSNNYKEVEEIAKKIKLEVNKLYRQIELEKDGVFRPMLLLKKKKYAAVTLNEVNTKLFGKLEIKGLDVVRRDWSPLSAKAGKYVLDQLLPVPDSEEKLNNQNLDDKLANIHAELKDIKTRLDQGSIPLNDLAIAKQLTKNPEDYPDKKSLPHVQVALRMNTTLTKKFKQGDTIFYVVCEDGTNNAATQRAYHVDELKNDTNLKVDAKYYLSQQVHPVVSRLCEPIDGIDAAQIAESLGLDSSSYTKRIDTIIEETEEIVVDEIEKYKNCERFHFICRNPKCRRINILESPVVKSEDGDYLPSLNYCLNSNCNRPPIEDVVFLQNKVVLAIRSFVHKYYQNWMVCEEPTCGYRTRSITGLNKKFQPLCPACSNKNILLREYNELQLYNQISYFEHLFDIEVIVNKCKMKVDVDTPLYKNNCKLKKQVNEFLQCNAYNIVDLGELYDQMLMK